MLSKKGFDMWADNYDQTVQVSQETNSYPFAGYKAILNQLYNEIMKRELSVILDIGFGTGILANKLYENGHQIEGIDFSDRMIEIASRKMPKARLLNWDISRGLPSEVKEKRYDSIVSTYALHHLTDAEKKIFLEEVVALLKVDGTLYIGDVAFQTRTKLKQCRLDHLPDWDKEEHYFVADELINDINSFADVTFHQLSHCGGIFVIKKKN